MSAGRIAAELNTYTEAEVAEFLGIETLTLRNQRSRGQGPPFLKLGATVLYGAKDFRAWVESNRHVPGGLL